MVTGHDEDFGIERSDSRDSCIKFLSTFNLLGEVAIFAGAVGVLEVDEEEIVFVPDALERFESVRRVLWLHRRYPCQRD